MTGGAGFSQDASNRSKQNRKLRLSIKDKYYKNEGQPSIDPDGLKFKEADPETIEKFKQEAIQRNKTERIKIVVVYGAVLFAVGIIVLWYLS